MSKIDDIVDQMEALATSSNVNTFAVIILDEDGVISIRAHSQSHTVAY